MAQFNRGTISGEIVDVSASYRPELREMGIAYALTVNDGDTATAYMTADEVFEKAMDMLRAYQRMMTEQAG